MIRPPPRSPLFPYPPLSRPPRVLRYAAVDEQCYDKLVCECGVPEERARVVGQFVDLERFAARTPLPSRPRRAAVLCNRSEEHTSELQSRLHLVCRLLLEKKK